jgi:DNA polymerase-3 subunit gamma/tau
LDVVKTRGRVARALLNDATVTSADEQEIVLAFPTSSLARQFSDPAKSDVLRAALREILGIDRRVRAVASGGAPAAEPDPVVDSVDSGPEPADAAVALLTDELGAKVISED